MGNLDPTKIAIVMIVALLVLGPEKLPNFAKQIGGWWREFQRIRSKIHSEINGAVNQLNSSAAPLTDVMNSTSASFGGFVQSIFTGDTSADNAKSPLANPVRARPQNIDANFIKPTSAEGGWGSDEEESGYRFGDPRLN